MFDQFPAEIIEQVFIHLSPVDVARCLLVCRTLNSHAIHDSIWQRFVQSHYALEITTPAPYKTWYDLYKANRPHLFLAKHKLWYSDKADWGCLVLARYDSHRGCVEAYQLKAKLQGSHALRVLNWGIGEVHTRAFNPHVFLDLNSPVVRLSPQDYMNPKQRFGKEPFVGGSRMQPEIQMHVSRYSTALDSLITNFLFARDLPPSLCDAQTELWPPLPLPSPDNSRTRRSSHNGYRAKGHAPETMAEASQTSFRIRHSLIFKNMMPIHGGVRFPGEDTETFGTLPSSCYTPTPQKPWQGIWVGDYMGHGPEFLLVTQPDPEDAKPLPEKCRAAFANWPRSTPWQALFRDAVPDVEEMGQAAAEDDDVGSFPPVAPTNLTAALHARHRREDAGEVPPVLAGSSSSSTSAETDEYPHRGRLEALKLTGDPNVQRGELTFVAEDLGARGLVGYTKDRGFVDPAVAPSAFGEEGAPPLDADWRGTRMVRSCGHVADTSPRRDSYIPSQLMLVSADCLAQWWIPYGHVAFYRRVPIEALSRS